MAAHAKEMPVGEETLWVATLVGGLGILAAQSCAASEPPPPPEITVVPSADIPPPSYVSKIEGTCADYGFAVRLTQARGADGLSRVTSAATYTLFYKDARIEFPGPTGMPKDGVHIIAVQPACNENEGFVVTTIYFDHQKRALFGIYDMFVRDAYYGTQTEEFESARDVVGFTR